MSPTPTEKRIQQDRHQQKGLVVPLLNELLKSPLGIDNESDANFLHMLAMKQVERERVRKEGDGVFSPSGLASCLRRVYLSKNWKQLGLSRVELPAIEPHFYFFTGDFLHLKWQFAFHKLSELCQGREFMLLDVEVALLSKRKDHGGTIDVVALIDEELVIIDVKGLNPRNFRPIDEGSPPHDYRIQVADYGMLWNSQRYLLGEHWERIAETLGWTEIPKVKRGIILAENKGGPDTRHPAALTETVINIQDNLPDVRARLELLRGHQEEGTFPAIECENTRGIQFTGCPFAEICRKEVKQRERAAAKSRDTKQYRVAQPKRNRRSRQSRSRR